MKIEFIPEPELEFGDSGRHVDIRFGLMQHGPLDYADPTAPSSIRLGIVGSPKSIGGIIDWLEKCRAEIPAKDSQLIHLFPAFPGCNTTCGLRTSLIMPSELQREISNRQIAELIKLAKSDDLVHQAVRLFMDEFEHLVENHKVDVLVCAWPIELLNAMESDEDPVGQLDFHDMLKAEAMRLRVPLQVVRPSTYDETLRNKQKRRTDKVRQTQDEATRAWNIHTALYYKAGGTPWRLVRDPREYDACYVGVSFYKSLDGSRLMTSVAQVFDQRGVGVVLRGGKAKLSKDDKHPYLEQNDAKKLLSDALDQYRKTHGRPPARVVLHKTSPFLSDEEEGFTQAIQAKDIDRLDLVSIGKSHTRLYRVGTYPPRRGTLLLQDETSHVLYTKGSVEFFAAYPGLYVPMPLLLRYNAMNSAPPKSLAKETLALTKMNWNNTQFDGSDPITIRAARQVSSILKYVGEDSRVEPMYSFYM